MMKSSDQAISVPTRKSGLYNRDPFACFRFAVSLLPFHLTRQGVIFTSEYSIN